MPFQIVITAENPYINCPGSIDFKYNSTVAFLIGGGDNVERTNYELNINKIIFEQVAGLDLNISFNIRNDSTLERTEDEGIWLKVK